jgi:hypothetical protein
MDKKLMIKFLLTLLVILSSCSCHENTVIAKDAGSDSDIDGEIFDVHDGDILEDVNDADANIDSGIIEYEDPFEVEVTCGRNVDDVGYFNAAGARFPYIYYMNIEYISGGFLMHFYSYNVETNEKRYITDVPLYSSKAMLVLATGEEVLYWASAYVIKQPEGEWPPSHYDNRIFRFDIETEEVEEVTSQYPGIISPQCEEKYGLLRIIHMNMDTQRALIECSFTPISGTLAYDIYSYKLDTGEVEYLVYGEESKYFSAFSWEEHNPEYVTLTGTSWVSLWDISGDSTTTFNVYLLENDQYSMIDQTSYEPHTMGTMQNLSGKDNMHYYGKLTEDNKLQIYGRNMVSGAIIESPEAEVFKSNPRNLAKEYPHLVAYNTGPPMLSSLSYDFPQLFPITVNQLDIWDKSIGKARQVTVIPSQYAFSGFIPRTPSPRYLLYVVEYGNGKCLFYKDLYDAGMMNQSGNLIPE